MPDETIKLGGDISLVGFEKLDDADITVIKKIVSSYIKRMSGAGGYKEMRLTLHSHQHGKSFKYGVEGLAFFDEGRFSSAVEEWNLFTAVSKACEKIFNEVLHSAKKEQRHDKKTFK